MKKKTRILTLEKSKKALNVLIISQFIMNYIVFILLFIGIVQTIYTEHESISKFIIQLIPAMIYYSFWSFVIVKILRKKVNSSTVIMNPFWSKGRTLNQFTGFNKVKSSTRLYKGFLDAVYSILDGNVRIFGKPIKRVEIKTHKIIIENLLEKLNCSYDKNTLYEEEDIDLRKSNDIEFNYGNKHVYISIKYLGQKILLEKCLIKKDPKKYLEVNYNNLKVSNYQLIIKINEIRGGL